MKTPNENKALDYKVMKDAIEDVGFTQTHSGSVSKDRVWSRKGNVGPYTLTGAYSIIQANSTAKAAPKPEKKETKKSKKEEDK